MMVFKTKDTLSLETDLNKILNKYHKKGYISASVDSIISDKNNVLIYFFIGDCFFWDTLTFYDSENQKIIIRKFSNKKVNFSELDKLIEKEIETYSNTGYPFAQAIFNDFKFNGNKISLDVFFQKKNFIVFDTIFYPNDVRIKQKFLQNYLQVKKGKPFNEKNYNDVENKLNQLEFLTLNQKPEIEFHNSTADLFLNLSNANASEIEGLLGFTTVNNNFLTTGKANFTFVNTFKTADKISLKWQKNKELSQDLNFYVLIPYIFNTSLGFSNDFAIEKFDTSYVNVFDKLEFSYFFSGYNSASAFVSASRSIVFDTSSNYFDFTYLMYGLSFFFKKVNYNLNPSKGYFFECSLGIGSKTKEKISKSRNEIFTNLGFYLPVYEKFVFYCNSFFYFLDAEDLYENELYKFGGSNMMRGFDEKSLRADLLLINTFELRFLFEKKSNFFVFADYSVFEHNTVNSKFSNHTTGVGAGINIGTKNNIFTLTYAIGKDDNTSFLFKNTKVHIGFKTLF